MRVSVKMLNNMIKAINDYTGKNWKLEYNTTNGYRVIEQTNERGSCRDISERMSAQKMYYFLRGVSATLLYIKEI